MEKVHFGMELRANGRRKVANDGFVEGWGQGEIVLYPELIADTTSWPAFATNKYTNNCSSYIYT